VGSAARPQGARLTQLVALQRGGSPKYLRFYAPEFYLMEYICAIEKARDCQTSARGISAEPSRVGHEQANAGHAARPHIHTIYRAPTNDYGADL
jgi:hypothetical protein